MEKIVVLGLLVLHRIDYGLIEKYAGTSIEDSFWIEAVGESKPRTEVLVGWLEIARGVIGLSAQ